mmetsp:Transcript_107806/g.336209  ORF Transcript_107806/g.336209 Transcript_107806/m.336209 type:complete len:300 (-) Transcript_107806:77-976(-)
MRHHWRPAHRNVLHGGICIRKAQLPCRCRARRKLDGKDPKGPYIDLIRKLWYPGEDLGRHEVGRAHRAELATGAELLLVRTDAKVAQEAEPLARHHHVVALDVAVDDAEVVQPVEGHRDVAQDRPRALRGDHRAVGHVGGGGAVNEFHGNEQVLGPFPPKDAGLGGLVELGHIVLAGSIARTPGLRHLGCQLLRVVGGQDLHGAALASPALAAEPDRAEAPGAKAFLHLVGHLRGAALEHVARRQARGGVGGPGKGPDGRRPGLAVRAAHGAGGVRQVGRWRALPLGVAQEKLLVGRPV